MTWAHSVTGHDIFCGTQFKECPTGECDSIAYRALDKGEHWIRSSFGCKRSSGEELEQDKWINFLARTYLYVIRPNRCGSLFDEPYYYMQAAIIGDAVMVERDRRHLESLGDGA